MVPLRRGSFAQRRHKRIEIGAASARSSRSSAELVQRGAVFAVDPGGEAPAFAPERSGAQRVDPRRRRAQLLRLAASADAVVVSPQSGAAVS